MTIKISEKNKKIIIIVTYGTKTGTGSYSLDTLQGGTVIFISEESEVSINHYSLAQCIYSVSVGT
ncbi:MAG: hypothetical protein R3Y23_06945 [Bacillota bacterium]